MFEPRRREYITVDASDPNAYDERGILKDGYRIRVPLVTMDAASLPFAAVPRTINTGLTGEHALSKFFYVDGSPKEPRRRKTVARDQMGRETEDAAVVTHDALADHKHGHRGVTDAGQALKDAAYTAMCDDLSRQWMPDYQCARTTDDAARPQGVSDAEWARELNRREISDAWKAPAPTLDARAAPNRPAGAWGPAGFGAKAGDPCTSNAGEAGVLREENGWLYCEVSRLGPTRSGKQSAGDVPVTRVDAVPRTMSAADGQALKDAAWNEMVADLTSAWKTPA